MCLTPLSIIHNVILLLSIVERTKYHYSNGNVFKRYHYNDIRNNVRRLATLHLLAYRHWPSAFYYIVFDVFVHFKWQLTDCYNCLFIYYSLNFESQTARHQYHAINFCIFVIFLILILFPSYYRCRTYCVINCCFFMVTTWILYRNTSVTERLNETAISACWSL